MWKSTAEFCKVLQWFQTLSCLGKHVFLGNVTTQTGPSIITFTNNFECSLISHCLPNEGDVLPISINGQFTEYNQYRCPVSVDVCSALSDYYETENVTALDLLS